MIDYKYKDLFMQDSVHKTITLKIGSNKVLTNSSIYAESLELTESICSEDSLKFGLCEASEFKIRIVNDGDSYIGKEMSVTITLDGGEDKPFPLGTYIITEANVTSNKKFVDIIAYDKMKAKVNEAIDTTYSWIFDRAIGKREEVRFGDILGFELGKETVYPSKYNVLEKISYPADNNTYIPEDLINKGFEAHRALDTSKTISKKEVVQNACEVALFFPHYNRNGKLEAIELPDMSEEYYDSDYSGDVAYTIPRGMLIDIQNSDYKTNIIKRVTITNGSVNASASKNVAKDEVPNTYRINGNYMFGNNTEENLTPVCEALVERLYNIRYTPAEIVCRANPCVEVGDIVRTVTDNGVVCTYVLQRTIKGIQNMTDTIIAEGVYEYPKVENGETSEPYSPGGGGDGSISIAEVNPTTETTYKGLFVTDESTDTLNTTSGYNVIESSTKSELQLGGTSKNGVVDVIANGKHNNIQGDSNQAYNIDFLLPYGNPSSGKLRLIATMNIDTQTGAGNMPVYVNKEGILQSLPNFTPNRVLGTSGSGNGIYATGTSISDLQEAVAWKHVLSGKWHGVAYKVRYDKKLVFIDLYGTTTEDVSIASTYDNVANIPKNFRPSSRMESFIFINGNILARISFESDGYIRIGIPQDVRNIGTGISIASGTIVRFQHSFAIN